MNLDINLTLLVQILNFFISYFLISNLFLKPAYNIIEKEDRELENMKNKVKLKLIKLEDINLTLKNKQLLFKDEFFRIKPKLNFEVNFISYYNSIYLLEKDYSLSNKDLTEKEIIEDSKNIANILKLKIINIE